jgi:hypothetical protein
MRIILDTNVISEEMKPSPYPAMQRWLQRQPLSTVYPLSKLRANVTNWLPEAVRCRPYPG